MDKAELIKTIQSQRNTCIKEIDLSLDDTFKFKCRQCGKCCSYRTDILLNPYDLFRIAKFFGRTPAEIIDSYCTTYTGEHSGLPLIQLNTQRVCPFLRNKRCAIHLVKPAVCRLYPLGRVTTTEDPPKVIYLLQEHGHPETEVHTVRDWIGDFATPEYIEIGAAIHKAMSKLVEYIHEVGRGPWQEKVVFVGQRFYLDYDISKPFLPQFKDNLKEYVDF